MKFVNFRAGKEVRLGVKKAAGIVDVKAAAEQYRADVPATIEEVIAAGPAGLAKLADLVAKDLPTVAEDNLVYAPCVTNPEKILCVGLNYVDHAEECHIPIPEFPVLFSKFNNALAAHKQEIVLPKTASQYDYEAELVVVIGKEAANVSAKDALSYVFGYAVGNDLSARDLQMRSGQWLIGKTCDNFAPMGPFLTTADEIEPQSLAISCTVNGVVRQSSSTAKMIFDCATVISYASQYMTLKPGDVIYTGTPHGVMMGYSEDRRVWLKSGDLVEVSIEKLGTLQNRLK